MCLNPLSHQDMFIYIYIYKVILVTFLQRNPPSEGDK